MSSPITWFIEVTIQKAQSYQNLDKISFLRPPVWPSYFLQRQGFLYSFQKPVLLHYFSLTKFLWHTAQSFHFFSILSVYTNVYKRKSLFDICTIQVFIHIHISPVLLNWDLAMYYMLNFIYPSSTVLLRLMMLVANCWIPSILSTFLQWQTTRKWSILQSPDSL